MSNFPIIENDFFIYRFIGPFSTIINNQFYLVELSYETYLFLSWSILHKDTYISKQNDF